MLPARIPPHGLSMWLRLPCIYGDWLLRLRVPTVRKKPCHPLWPSLENHATALLPHSVRQNSHKEPLRFKRMTNSLCPDREVLVEHVGLDVLLWLVLENIICHKRLKSALNIPGKKSFLPRILYPAKLSAVSWPSWNTSSQKFTSCDSISESQ